MARKTDPRAREQAARRTAAWLQAFLRRYDWTVSDLARELRTEPSSVSRWVRGVQPPNPDYAIRLADVFNDDPDYVLALAGHRPASLDDDLDAETRRIIALARRVDWSVADRFIQIEANLDRWAKQDKAARTARQSS